MRMVCLYRAMSREEWFATQALKRPAYIGRWKWFSPDRDWVQQRVMDGNFNNSKFVPGRYSVLVVFDISAQDSKWFDNRRGCAQCGEREWALHKRRAHQVRWRQIRMVLTTRPFL